MKITLRVTYKDTERPMNVIDYAELGLSGAMDAFMSYSLLSFVARVELIYEVTP